MKKKLNLGSGCDVKEDYVNLDCVNIEGTDVVHNLEDFPYPFEENTFEEVYAHQTLEHLSDKIKVMNEIWRICKNGAEVHINVPYFAFAGAFCHAEHKSFFGYNTFEYWTNSSREIRPTSNFELISRELQFSNSNNPFMKFLDKIISPIININRITAITYQRFFCWILPCENLIVKLRVIK